MEKSDDISHTVNKINTPLVILIFIALFSCTMLVIQRSIIWLLILAISALAGLIITSIKKKITEDDEA